jgi:hypothetical protein
MAMAVAIMVGLIGAAIFIINGASPTKTKSKKDGLKPRGTLLAVIITTEQVVPPHPPPPCSQYPAECLVRVRDNAEDLYAQ